MVVELTLCSPWKTDGLNGSLPRQRLARFIAFKLTTKWKCPIPHRDFSLRMFMGPAKWWTRRLFSGEKTVGEADPGKKLSSTNCTWERLQPREHFAESSRSSTISVISAS